LVDSGLWISSPAIESLTKPAIIQAVMGVNGVASVSIGGVSTPQPVADLRLGDTNYLFYRHLDFYKSVRVERFVGRYWYSHNSGVHRGYEELAHWDIAAMRIYKLAYETALKRVNRE